jgi:PIN domain nuclease of toxin-antitoxin system
MIDRADDVRVCAISLLEIATAASNQRLELKQDISDWLAIAQSPTQIRIEPLTDRLCVESVKLPEAFHRDPADRLIVALARLLTAKLVTADRKILDYPHVETIAAE